MWVLDELLLSRHVSDLDIKYMDVQDFPGSISSETMELIMFTSPGCKYCELVKKRMPSARRQGPLL